MIALISLVSMFVTSSLPDVVAGRRHPVLVLADRRVMVESPVRQQSGRRRRRLAAGTTGSGRRRRAAAAGAVSGRLVDDLEHLGEVVLNGGQRGDDGWRPKAVRDEREVRQSALHGRVEDRSRTSVAERGPVLIQQVDELFDYLPAYSNQRIAYTSCFDAGRSEHVFGV